MRSDGHLAELPQLAAYAKQQPEMDAGRTQCVAYSTRVVQTERGGEVGGGGGGNTFA